MRHRVLRAVALVLVLLAATVPATATATRTTSGWCPALRSGTVLIDAVGDSILNAGTVTDPDSRWYSLLENALRADGVTAHIRTDNAVPGTTTTDFAPGGQYADRLEELGRHPDLIITDWSINDWWFQVDVPRFEAQYQQIIDRMRQLSGNSTLLVLHTPWVLSQLMIDMRGDQQPYLDAISRLVQRNRTLYLGLEPYFNGRADLFGPDGIHQNAAGQVVIAEALHRALRAAC